MTKAASAAAIAIFVSYMKRLKPGVSSRFSFIFFHSVQPKLSRP